MRSLLHLLLLAALATRAAHAVLNATVRDGVLSVEVRDPRTGAVRATALRDAEGLYADDELDARRLLVASLAIEHDAL